METETEPMMTETESILEVLEEARQLVEKGDPDMMGGKIVHHVHPEGDRWTYANRYFMLDGIDNKTFLLSFTVNDYRIGKVAMITHLLTLMLYDDLKMAEDNFVDINTNTVYYGDEAYLQFAEHIKRKKGLMTCPVCEMTCTTEMFIEDKGYCRLCERDVMPFVTIH